MDSTTLNSSSADSVFFTPSGSEKKPSATDIVVNKIKELILNKSLQPGDLLPSEMVIANAMNVSRGSVREAMKVLSAFGVVEIKQGDGTYITKSISKECFNPLLFSLLSEASNIHQIIELREIFELGIVKLIINHASDEEISRIRSVVNDFDAVIRSGSFTDDDIYSHEIKFHRVLSEATCNPLVVHMYDFLMDFFCPHIKQTTNRLITASGNNTLKIHNRIVSALEERNLTKAERAINSSMKTWGLYAR